MPVATPCEAPCEATRGSRVEDKTAIRILAVVSVGKTFSYAPDALYELELFGGFLWLAF